MLSALNRLVDALSSRRFATTLILAWLGLVVVWVVPFEFYGLPNAQIKRIVYQESFFRLVYLLFTVSTLACILPRIARQVRRARVVPSAAAKPAVSEDGARLMGNPEPDAIVGALKDSRFSSIVAGDGWVWAVKNRWTPLGSTLFHVAILLVMLSVTLFNDPAYTFTGRAVLAEGEQFTGAAAQYTSIESTETGSAGVPALSFQVESIRPRFHEDLLLFTDLTAKLQPARGGSRNMRLSAPWMPDPSTMVAIEDFGYAAEAKASPRGDSSEGTTTVYKLKVFPSGTMDTFDTQPVDESQYRIGITVFSDYVDRNGTPGSKSFNLKNPRLLLSVSRILSTQTLKPLVEGALVPLGKPVQAGDAVVTVERLRYYGVFRITRSPAAPVMMVALISLLLGLVVRLGFPRTETLVVQDGDSVRVTVRDDAYGLSLRRSERLAASLGREGAE